MAVRALRLGAAMSSRLYHTIIVFGTAIGVGGGTAVALSGCDLYFNSPTPQIDAQHGIIDAPFGTIADAPWGIIDAPPPPDAAIDAVLPDAPTDGSAT